MWHHGGLEPYALQAGVVLLALLVLSAVWGRIELGRRLRLQKNPDCLVARSLLAAKYPSGYVSLVTSLAPCTRVFSAAS